MRELLEQAAAALATFADDVLDDEEMMAEFLADKGDGWTIGDAAGTDIYAAIEVLAAIREYLGADRHQHCGRVVCDEAVAAQLALEEECRESREPAAETCDGSGWLRHWNHTTAPGHSADCERCPGCPACREGTEA